MNIQTLHFEQDLPRPLPEVFAFFEKPENLERITPPWLHFRILTPKPIQMSRGTLIDYSVRPFLWTFRWTSYIETYEPPHRFVDSQLRGPYSFWHHTHTFREVQGGTRIEDTLRYAVPLWWLGELMGGWLVRRQLNAIFTFRKKAIVEALGG